VERASTRPSAAEATWCASWLVRACSERRLKARPKAPKRRRTWTQAVAIRTKVMSGLTGMGCVAGRNCLSKTDTERRQP